MAAHKVNPSCGTRWAWRLIMTTGRRLVLTCLLKLRNNYPFILPLLFVVQLVWFLALTCLNHSNNNTYYYKVKGGKYRLLYLLYNRSLLLKAHLIGHQPGMVSQSLSLPFVRGQLNEEGIDWIFPSTVHFGAWDFVWSHNSAVLSLVTARWLVHPHQGWISQTFL